MRGRGGVRELYLVEKIGGRIALFLFRRTILWLIQAN